MIPWSQKKHRAPTTASEWFAALHAGDKDLALEQAFENWLAEDPERRRQYALCELAWELARPAAERLHSTTVNVSADTGISRRRWMIRAGLAAALLIAVIAPWAIFDTEPASLHFVTGPGEQHSVALSDGSYITLNTRTTLTANIEAHQRNIFLEEGEAFFDVAHDASRPFHVLTPFGRVTAIGTRFNVYRHNNFLEIATEQGLVRVSSSEHLDLATDLLVRAGEGAKIAKRGAKPQRQHADLQRIENWRQQRLEFEAMPLSKLLEEFNRYTTISLRAANLEIGALRVSGVFHLGDITALVAALDAAFGLEVHDSGDGVLVVSRPEPRNVL